MPFSVQNMTSNEINPNIKNPDAKGMSVPSYICPKVDPRVRDMTDDTAPKKADASPAICPMGSIAIAFMLPKVSPKQKNIMDAHSIKTSREGGASIVWMNSMPAPMLAHKSAAAVILRIPKRSTNFAFVKKAAPIARAIAPK